MTYAFSFVFPFLLFMAMGQLGLGLSGRSPGGACKTGILALLAFLMVLMPAGGIRAGRWLVSLQANNSILLTALLFSQVFKRAFGPQLLDQKATLACFLFATGAGFLLYPMALGIGIYDPYCAGWGFSWLFCLTFALTILLVVLRNRFSIVLLAAMLAYDFNLLESNNLWDYMVDPLLVAISVTGIIWKHRACRTKKRLNGTDRYGNSSGFLSALRIAESGQKH